MSPRWIGGLSFLFIVGTMISLVIEGTYLGQDEMDIINELAGYSALSAGGIMTIPQLAFGFITHGLPKMLMWDYAFFDGPYEIIRFFFIPLSIAVVWGLIQTFIGIAQGLLGKFVG